MSEVGKTQLRGHGLEFEGRRRFERDGITESRDWSGSARCSCGLLSDPGVTVNAARRWHREHKDAVRALYAPSGDAQGERAHGDGTTAQGSSQGDVGGKR